MTDTPSSSQPDSREAEIVSRHLPPGYSAGHDVVADDHGAAAGSAADSEGPGQESSLKLQGGDMHRDLFKINAKAKLLQRRSRTFSHPDPPRSYGSAPDSSFHNGTFSAVEQRAPGGFRRQFIQQQRGRLESVTAPVTRNFVAFLDLYGGFAGEDLYESEDDIAVESGEDEEAQAAGGERTPLLRRRRSSKARKPGDAGQMRAFFTLLKAFVGTGIMFLPKAFSNGGILFSSIAMVVVSILTCICFHLLLQCRKRYGGSYGDIGEEIGGPRMRSLILSSITISQIGFVCACIIFTAENFSSFLDAVTPTTTRPLSTAAFIGLQLLLLIPFSLIRNISKLGPAALVADICIMLGLSYIYYYDISSLASRGIHKSVVLFNPAQYTLTIGSSIFAFEGIGLILPIQSSMAEPDKFSPLLYLVMLLITLVFTSVGALSYATFGSTTMTELISNLPQSDPLVNAVQFLYAFAVLVGTPVQLFPAVRILEARLFGHRSGKSDRVTKWRKNAFRAAVVAVCGLVSVAGASDLDRFVALIGSFACVPLVYIYPALLHYKGVATSRAVVVGDVLLMALGLLAMVYTTIVTVAQWS